MEDRVAEWLKLAEQARAIAKGMRDPISKKTMTEIAAAYDQLAAVAVEREGTAGNTSD